MKILSSEQVRAADQYTIENEPIASIDLMERAATTFCEWFIENFENQNTVHIFCGQGNNGGDGLVIARLLLKNGYSVQTSILKLKEKGSPDFEENLKRLKKVKKHQPQIIEKKKDIPKGIEANIIIDALFGSGLDRPLKGLPAQLIKQLNQENTLKVAVDIPSGLKADENSEGVIFMANYTFCFERPKQAFFLAQNVDYVGYWSFRSIGLSEAFIDTLSSNNQLITFKEASLLLRGRSKFSHKGTYGHTMIIGGSHGKSGAVILATKACMRVGAGLCTAHIPSYATTALHASVPEAMLNIDAHKYLVSKVEIPEKVNVLGIGPGMGQGVITEAALKGLIETTSLPSVWDADALNLLAKNPAYLKKLRAKSILTPHPKEFERLFGKTKNNWEQIELLRKKAKQLKLIIVLKGAHTAIALPDGNIWWNNTGNPGMATGGSGDVLTGIIAGLLAQNYSSEQAAILGVYLHGLAGDLALKKLHPNFILASDIIQYLNEALRKLSLGHIEE